MSFHKILNKNSYFPALYFFTCPFKKKNFNDGQLVNSAPNLQARCKITSENVLRFADMQKTAAVN